MGLWTSLSNSKKPNQVRLVHEALDHLTNEDRQILWMTWWKAASQAKSQQRQGSARR